jgi:hypothetical protein
MNKILAGIACLALSVGVSAQGLINFNNAASAIGTAAPVFDVDGTTKLEGSAYWVQLYAGPTADSLAAWGPALNFRTGAGAGIFNTTTSAANPTGSARTVGSVAPGDVAQVVVRAWEAAGGTSFEAAVASGAKFGGSSVLSITTGGAGEPPTLPANLVGLTSFSLVPEPSTYALLALGAAALFLRRRK